MRFYEFINILRDNSNEKSQERYLACVVSALCGETNPISNNKRHSLSSFLPESLASITDSSNRKKIFSEKSKGFSNSTKQDIRISVDRKRVDGEHTSRDTFIAYLEQSVLKDLSSLYVAFDIPNTIDKFIVFKGIYEQFMAFVRSTNDEADFIIPEIVKKLSGDTNGLKEATPPKTEPNVCREETELNNESEKASQIGTSSEGKGLYNDGLPVPDEVEEKRIKIVDTPENIAEPEKGGIPVFRRSESESTEATKEKIRNDDTSVEPELEASEDKAQKKEIYERWIPMDLALEKLGEIGVLDQMFRSFKQTYDYYGIADYIKGTPDYEPDIVSFVAHIDSGILSSYEEHFDSDIYKLIVEFCTELKKFNKLVSLNISNKQAGELDKLAKERKKISLLYEKIFSAGVELSIFSNGSDIVTDKVSYIWRRNSDS